MLRYRTVGNSAVDEKWRKTPRTRATAPLGLRCPPPRSRTTPPSKGIGEHPCISLGVVIRFHIPRTAGHLLHHGAGVERVGIIPQDAPAQPSILVLVRADSRLTCHMLAGKYEAWATDHRSLQHCIRLLVGGHKAPAACNPNEAAKSFSRCTSRIHQGEKPHP